MKLILTALILTAASILSAIRFLTLRSREEHRGALVYKCLTALFFCAVGLTFSGFRGWVLPGLHMGLLGDLLLGLRKLWPKHHDLTFVSGALAFSVGHGFYILALLELPGGSLLPALPLLLVLTGLSEVYAHIAAFHKGKMHLAGMAYIAIEAAMCSVALVRFCQVPAMGTALFALGGLSFLVSDNLLCAYSFGRFRSRAMDWALHGTYLAAQLLIAWSTFFTTQPFA